MGTHPIFESDFDCLTACNGFTMTKVKASELRGKSKDELMKQLNEHKQELNNLRVPKCLALELLPSWLESALSERRSRASSPSSTRRKKPKSESCIRAKNTSRLTCGQRRLARSDVD